MPVNIPNRFFEVKYVSARVPGCENQSVLSLGANCQVFAYELLRENGLDVPNARSSELWADDSYSQKVSEFEPLDVMLYNNNPESYGAHVGVYIGNGEVLHLSLENGVPKIEGHEEMLRNPKYMFFIGAKRIIRSGT